MKKSKNILIVNWRELKNPLYGGAEIHITKIAEFLAKDHNVFFLSSSYVGCTDYEKNGVKYIHFGKEYLFNFSVIFNLKRILKNYSIDLIIEDINKLPFFTPLFTKIPVFVIVPHIFGKTIFKQTNFVFGFYIYIFEKFIPFVYKNTIFEVISNSTKDDLVKRGIKPDKIFVIECGIDEKFFTDRYTKNEFPQICYVGRLKKYKSIDHLILAFRKVKEKIRNVKLYIVGTGDYEIKLKRLVENLKLHDDVIFTGYVSEEEKIKILQESWISVYPSFIEGWGIVNIESNALSTPVISSNVMGLKDSVKDNFSGLLYEYGNIEELSEKILFLLNNKKILKNFEKNSVEWAKNFTWEKTGRESQILIENFLGIGPIDF